MAGRGRDRIWWVVAGTFVVIGVVVSVIGLVNNPSAAYGWFAYQPLSEATFTPLSDAVFLSRMAVIGFMFLAIGLVGAAFLLGRRVGMSGN